MSELLQMARGVLLEACELTDGHVQAAMGHMLGGRIDAADLYFQTRWREHWALEEGLVKSASFDIEQGVGVRAMSEDKTGFAYAEDVTPASLIHAASAARSIADHTESQVPYALQTKSALQLYPPHNPLVSLPDDKKVALLQSIDRHLRQADSRVDRVSASLSGTYEVILVTDHTGMMRADVRPMVRLDVHVIVEEKGRREMGYCGGGGRGDYARFLEGDTSVHYADEALRIALINLEAQPAPAGTMPVVLGPGWPGVLLHEAVGHGLEADFNRKQTSVFSNRIGEQVANSVCTIVDDGTLAGRRGSLNMDDEGTTTQCNTLIEKGILRNYMQDTFNARLMGMAPTGNGRRESYAHLPMPRMTNTYMLPGKLAPEEIIASVDRGIYAVNLSGGQVDITSGNFVFTTSEAYLIEGGKITAPLKDATLIGNGPEVLGRISMVGCDLSLDEGVGICGKAGQSVPVGVGQPTLKVDALTVGGVAG